jgi:hypothetical protein
MLAAITLKNRVSVISGTRSRWKERDTSSKHSLERRKKSGADSRSLKVRRRIRDQRVGELRTNSRKVLQMLETRRLILGAFPKAAVHTKPKVRRQVEAGHRRNPR